MREKRLKISREVTLPIDALMQPIGLLGNRGAGKTYGGMKLFELAYDAEAQCIAIDGIGKWWGLRLDADGHSAGLKVYIFGGKRADFPLTPDRGAFVAKVLVEHRIHAVIDVSQWRKADRRRFLTDFAEEFHLLKKQEDQPAPSVLFLEEAHQVLPQKPFGDEARMLGAFEDIIREGRNAGIGVVVMDQRPATVNKNALALTEILITLRTTYESDRAVYTGWIVQKGGGGTVDLEKELPFLKAGEGYLYAPIYETFERINLEKKRTFDSSATAKIGVTAKAIGDLTPVDVERVKGAMATVTAEVAAKDPVALRRKVAELEKRLAAAPGPAPVAVRERERERVKVAVLERGLVARLEAVSARAQQVAAAFSEIQKAFAEQLATARRTFPSEIGSAGPVLAPKPPPPAHVSPRPVHARAAPVPANGEGPTRYARQLLETLAARQPLRPTRSQLAILAGRSIRSSEFSRASMEMSREGWVRVADGLLELSADGLAVIGGSAPVPQTPDQLQATWLAALQGYDRSLLQVLIQAWPQRLDRPSLAERAGRSLRSSEFSRAIVALKKNKLATEVDHGLAASDSLFN